MNYFYALTLLKLKKFEEAHKHLVLSISQSETYKLSYNIKLSICLRQLNRLDESIRILQESLNYHPNNYGTFYQLAICYEKLNKKQYALENFQKSYKIKQIPATFKAIQRISKN